jgi:uncharacterized coiled-coil protein SlyX
VAAHRPVGAANPKSARNNGSLTPPTIYSMHDQSLEQIQSKIAYLERSMAELSDVVFRQHKEIQILEAHLKALKDRLEGTPFDEIRTLEQASPLLREDR